MPSISDRAIVMPESPIRKLAPLASAAKEREVFMCIILISASQMYLPLKRD